MHLIFFIIFICKVHAESNSNEAKYIDLLPDEEKQAFLDKIARRIFDEIQTKNEPYKGREKISNEELDKYSEYVSKVIKQEAVSLRRDREDLPDISNTDEKKILREHLQAKLLENDKKLIQVDDEYVKDHIDFTLQQGLRKKRNNDDLKHNDLLKGNNDEIILVTPIYNEDILKINQNQNSYIENQESLNDNTDVSSVIPLKKSIVHDSDIQVRGYKRYSRNFAATNSITTTVNNTDYLVTKTIHFNPKESTELEKADYINETTTYKGVKDNETSNTVSTKKCDSENKSKETKSINGFTQKIYDTFENGDFANTSKNNERIIESKITYNKVNISGITISQIPINETTEKISTNSENMNEILLRRQGVVSHNDNNVSTIQEWVSTQESTVRDNFDENTLPSIGFTENILSSSNNTDNKFVHNIPLEKENIELNYYSNESDTLNVALMKNNTDYDDKLQEQQATSQNSNLTANNTTDISNITNLKIMQQSYTTKQVLEEEKKVDTTVSRPDSVKEKENNEIVTKKINERILLTQKNNDEVTIIKKTTLDSVALNINQNHSYSNQNNVSVFTNPDLVSSSNNKMLKNEKLNLKQSQKLDENEKILNNGENKSITKNVHSIINILRQGISYNKQESVEDDSNEKVVRDFNLNINNKNIKEYNVYEISNDQPTFISNNEGHEQPYYAPIYKYSPRNAYFNSYNRLVPNYEDESRNGNDDEVVKNVDGNKKYNNIAQRSIGSLESNIRYDTNRKFRFRVKNSDYPKIKRDKTTYHISLPLAVKKPQVTTIHIKPDDYLDADYYFGRSDNTGFNKRSKENKKSKKRQFNKPSFSGFSKEMNPYQDIKSENGSFIRAIKKILYQNKIFGNVPSIHDKLKMTTDKNEIDNETPKAYLRTKVANDDYMILLSNNKHGNFDDESYSPSNIAVDYYFSRTYSDEESNTKNIKNRLHLQRLGDMKDSLQVEKPPNSYRNSIKNNNIVYGNDEILPITPRSNKLNDRRTTEVPKLRCYKFRKGKKITFCDSNKSEISEEDETVAEYVIETDKVNDQYIINLNNGVNENQVINDDDASKVKQESKKYANAQIREEYNIKPLTIKDIINTAGEDYVLENFDRLVKPNISLTRTSDREIDAYVEVMKDLYEGDSKLLEQYDWLGTTVNIQSALNKLINLIDLSQNGQNLHPSDLELLQYVMYLHNLASKTVLLKGDRDLREKKIKKNKIILPRNMKEKKHKLLTKGLLDRVWLYRYREKSGEDGYLDEDTVGNFLIDLRSAFNDLHDAIKHIAIITQFRNQRWLANLKELYLDHLSRKKILEVNLHLFTNKLLDLIEHSASDGLEDGFLKYVQNNEKEVETAKEEFVFVLKFMDEIKKSLV